jgi:hypothetical protein
MNPLSRYPVVRALLRAMDAWVSEGTAPPPSRYPRISDGTLVTPQRAGWPDIPGVHLPPPMLITYRLDFGPDWSRGIVAFEPPRVGKPFTALVPAVDQDGNNRAGIRLPAIQVPIATYAGWNFRSPASGASDQLSGEAGSFHPLARTRAGRGRDSRRSLEERYTGREQYLGMIREAARKLISERLLLAAELPDLLDQAAVQYDWATRPDRK